MLRLECDEPRSVGEIAARFDIACTATCPSWRRASTRSAGTISSPGSSSRAPAATRVPAGGRPRRRRPARERLT